MTTTKSQHVGHANRAGHRGAMIWVGIALAAIACKLPQAAIGLAVPEGIEGLTPVVANQTGVYITLAWVGFSMAVLFLRTWLGALSSVFFCVVSASSALRYLGDGYHLWGGWQLATSIVAVVAIALAVRQGAFTGSRW